MTELETIHKVILNSTDKVIKYIYCLFYNRGLLSVLDTFRRLLINARTNVELLTYNEWCVAIFLIFPSQLVDASASKWNNNKRHRLLVNKIIAVYAMLSLIIKGHGKRFAKLVKMSMLFIKINFNQRYIIKNS